MAALATKDITGANSFTDAVMVLAGDFSISVSGTFSATVTVQKSYDTSSPSNFEDVETFTAPVERVGYEAENIYYRVGVKTGEYTSGTVSVRIGGKDIQ
tara:strand:- start:5586 stop:5882 length:297 start_codon:yes stop_codon:yes gene_type:complete